MSQKKENAQELHSLIQRIETKGIDVVPFLEFINDEIGFEIIFQYLPKLHKNYLNLFLLHEQDMFEKKEIRNHLLLLSGMEEAIFKSIVN